MTPSEVVSPITKLPESTYQGIPLPLSNENKQVGALPSAWLVFNDEAFPAQTAASKTLEAYLGPAEAFPRLSPITIPAQAQFNIVIASTSITELLANVVPWDPQINPLPFIESEGQVVSHTMVQEQEFTVFALTAIYKTKEQFLHVFVTFSETSSADLTGYAHYLWRVVSGE